MDIDERPIIAGEASSSGELGNPAVADTGVALGMAIAEALNKAMEHPQVQWTTQTPFSDDSVDLSSVIRALESWVGPQPTGILGWIGEHITTEEIQAFGIGPVETYVHCRGGKHRKADGTTGNLCTMRVLYNHAESRVWNVRHVSDIIHAHARNEHAGEFMEEGAGIGVAHRAWLTRHRALRHLVNALYNQMGG